MKKHIVHVHEKFYPFMGGSTHRLLNLLKAIDKNEFEITILCERQGNRNFKEEYLGINIIRFEKYSQIPKLLKTINKKKKIDLIHSHNYRPSFFSYLPAKVKYKVPFILEMHSIYKTNKIKGFIGNFILKKSDEIIVLSEKSKEMLIENYHIRDNGNITVIYNGIKLGKTNIDLNELKERIPHIFDILEASQKENKILITYIGSLDPFQGIENMIEIINNVKNDNLQFLIIGGNEKESQILKEQIKNKNCYISPYISSNFVYSIYRMSNYLLVPRPSMLSTESAVPLKPLEALVNENIVLSTPVGGMKELKKITQNENIIFLNDANDFIRYLNVVDKAPTYSNENAGNLDYFNVEKQSIKLVDLYKRILSNEK